MCDCDSWAGHRDKLALYVGHWAELVSQTRVKYDAVRDGFCYVVGQMTDLNWYERLNVFYTSSLFMRFFDVKKKMKSQNW